MAVSFAERRREAEDAEGAFREALLAGRRGELGEGKIEAPPALERRPERVGGGYRTRSSSYDWFYGLSRAEQSRIRNNWMVPRGRGLSPDEVESVGLPMDEWLALTRGIDAARAVRTGRHLAASRYGGRNPVAFLARGDPEDHGRPLRRAHHRDGDRVQFFTDEEGVVHPIRASYERRGRRAAPVDYGADEPF